MKKRTNIIVGLTSMALFAGFAGYTTHYDLTKNRLTLNSAPIAMTSQEVHPILPKAEPVVAKAEQQPPLTSVTSPNVVAMADTAETPAPTKKKTTKTRAS